MSSNKKSCDKCVWFKTEPEIKCIYPRDFLTNNAQNMQHFLLENLKNNTVCENFQDSNISQSKKYQCCDCAHYTVNSITSVDCSCKLGYDIASGSRLACAKHFKLRTTYPYKPIPELKYRINLEYPINSINITNNTYNKFVSGHTGNLENIPMSFKIEKSCQNCKHLNKQKAPKKHLCMKKMKDNLNDLEILVDSCSEHKFYEVNTDYLMGALTSIDTTNKLDTKPISYPSLDDVYYGTTPFFTKHGSSITHKELKTKAVSKKPKPPPKLGCRKVKFKK